MSRAHKGSRLKLRDQIVAVNFDAAHFDYQVDATGIQYGSLVEPNAGAVYTMRPNEGRFGNAIAIEQSATNLTPAGIRTCAVAFPAQHGNVAEVTYTRKTNIAGRADVASIKVVGTETANNYAYFGFSRDGVSAAGDVMTVSFDYKILSGVKYPQLSYIYGSGFKTPTDANVGSLGPEIISELGGGWFRYRQTVTTSVAGATFFRWNYYSGNTLAEVLVDNFQVEAGAIDTSFVDGTRTTGALQYTLPTNTNAMTANFWLKASNWSSNYGFYINFFKDTADQDNRLYLRPNGETQISAGRVVGGVIHTIGTAEVANIKNWNMYTLVSNGSTMTLYQNGKVALNSTGIAELTSASLLLNMSEYGGSNILISDMRIDNSIISEEEIAAWYASEKPQYNPYDYRSFAY